MSSSRVALATGITVRVVRAGDPARAPIVLLHGWGVHAYMWRRNIGALVAAGRHVIAVDLPGHGLSDRPLAPGSYTVDAFARHIVALFDALGVTRAPIVGQSMGGRIAIEVARSQPSRVASLVLFGSVGLGEVPAMVALAPRLPVPETSVSTLLVRRWLIALSKAAAYGTRRRPDRADVDAYWAPTQFPEFLAAARQAMIEFDWRPLAPEVLATIATPALVVFGTRDRTVRPLHTEALVGAMPHGRLAWIRDAGHVANEEADDEVNSLLVQFIVRAD